MKALTQDKVKIVCILQKDEEQILIHEMKNGLFAALNDFDFDSAISWLRPDELHDFISSLMESDYVIVHSISPQSRRASHQIAGA
jgi:hypothetical protein